VAGQIAALGIDDKAIDSLVAGAAPPIGKAGVQRERLGEKSAGFFGCVRRELLGKGN